jgi:hypothetical protein
MFNDGNVKIESICECLGLWKVLYDCPHLDYDRVVYEALLYKNYQHRI